MTRCEIQFGGEHAPAQRATRRGRGARSRYGVWAALTVLLGAIAGGVGCSSDADPTRSGAAAEPSADDAADAAASRQAAPARWQDRLLSDAPVPVEVKPDTIDLGVISRHDVQDIEATLLNTGEKTLRIATSLADCGCTTVDMAGAIIEPGESIDLEATFVARERTGERTSTISVVFEGYSDPLRIPIRAFVE